MMQRSTMTAPEKAKTGMRKLPAFVLFLGSLLWLLSATANAAIENTATATGTFNAAPIPSNSSSASVPVTPTSADISLNKTWAFTPGGDVNNNGLVDPGDTILFSFEVSNSGTATLNNVSVSDPTFQGTGTQSAVVVPVSFTDGGAPGGSSDTVTGDGDWDLLGPGDTVVFTRTYTVPVGDFNIPGNTDDDIDTIGEATADAGAVVATDPEDVPLNAATGAITLAKTGSPDFNVVAPAGVANVGDTINYTFVVTNTGTVTLDNVTVTDPGLTVVGGVIGSLAPGASATAVASLALTQVEIDAGIFNNTANVTGDPANGAPQVLAADSESVTLPAPSTITLDKVGTLNDGGDGIANVGDTVSYAFTVQNTGGVTLNAVTLTDPGLTVVGGTMGSLAPGDTANATATLTLTQPLIDAGVYNNTATVSGTPANGSAMAPVNDSATVPLPAPAITLVKSGTVNAGGNGRPDVGETITYTFTVSNTGNVPLTNVTVNDPLVIVSGGPIALAAGQSNATNFTATYVLTQADIDAGAFANTATASGNPPTGAPVTSPGATNTVLAPQPLLTLSKTGTADFTVVAPPSTPTAGDTISYSFAVQNTGNITLDNVTLTDPNLVVVGGAIGTLVPGATATATAVYTITQSDINAGVYDNTATVVGDPRNGAPQLSVDDSESIPLPNAPAITLDKRDAVFDFGVDGLPDPNDTITYSFTVTNTGSTTLTGVTVIDPLATVSGGPISLAPGAFDDTTFTAVHAITQTEIDAGNFVNTAQARGTPPSGPDITAIDTLDTPIPQPPGSLTIDKSAVASFGPDGIPQAGETIAYSFLVTNTGRTTLTNVRIADDLIASASLPSASALASLDSLRFGADPLVTASTEAEHSVAAEPLVIKARRDVPGIYSNLNVVRRVVLLSGDPSALLPGDRVGILHEITNSGDGPLVAIRMKQIAGEVFSDTIDYLAPGDSDDSSIIMIHELTLEEITSGIIDIGSSLSAKSRTNEIRVDANAPLAIEGAETYDELATASLDPVTLAPGQSHTFTTTYTLTQNVLDNVGNVLTGGIDLVNTAMAQGNEPDGDTIDSPPDSATTPLPAAPAISMVKTATPNFSVVAPSGIPNIGDTISYEFDVTNDGNVTMNNVVVTDPLLGGALSPVINNLRPGMTQTVTRTYTLSAADQAAFDAATLHNDATANGTPVRGAAPPDAVAMADVPLPQQPRIAVLKPVPTVISLAAGLDPTRVDMDDTVQYVFRVTNEGNVTLNTVSVSDPLPGLAPPVLSSGDDGDGLLEFGETWEFTAQYTLTQNDLNVGRVTNRATANGLSPTNVPATDQSHPTSKTQNADTVLLLQQNGSVAVVKSYTGFVDANGDGLVNKVGAVGDTINYDVIVTNTGTVTLDPVTLDDPNGVLATSSIGPLLPGATNAITVTATHVVTDADMLLDPKQVSNQVTATGRYTSPTGVQSVTDDSDESDITGDDPTITPLGVVSVALLKPQPQVIDTVADGVTGEGDTLRYTFTVVNTGTEDLTNIVVTDPLAAPGGVQGTLAALAVGQTDDTSLTFDYVITAADMTVGTVTNSAQVTAQGGPSNTPVQDDSDESSITENDPTVTPVGIPSIALVKTAGVPRDVNNNGVTDVGDVIDYVFRVTNTGGVRLTNVRVTDTKVGPITGSPIAQLLINEINDTLTASYVITQTDINRGYVENQATVIADYQRGTTSGTVDDLSDDSSPNENDPTRTNLTQQPSIALIKTVASVTDTNANGVNDPGDVINYSFAVTNTGNTTLRDVRVTDANAVVSGGPLQSLTPGATNSRTFTATHRVTGADAAAGKVVNSARAVARGPANSVVSDVSDNNSLNGNNPTVVTVFTAPPTVTKTAGRSEIRRGERVTYTITANGLTGLRTAIRDVMPGSFIFIEGSATANGQPIVPKQEGRNLTFTGYTIDIDGSVVIKLRLIAGATLTSGKFINTAQVINRDNGAVVAVATAAVEIKPEHVFDCGDVIGRVFNDLNGNGYADDGEPGLPGVNVVTVNGLIITSDSAGRFHIACADIPNVGIGSNFILKLDLSSLPQGFVLTTENPRDVRLTRGKVTKLNFGVRKSCDVRLDLRKDAFITDSTRLKPKWTDGLGRLSDVLQQCPGKLEVVYTCGKQHPIISGRLDSIENAIRERWAVDGAPYDLNITTRAECSK